MIRKLKSGGYRLYSRKINPKTGRRRNLGTFKTRAEAERHERAVQFFKRDRKSTCLNSSHSTISYAVFCLKKTHGRSLLLSSASRQPKRAGRRAAHDDA